jgi:hypothetical protein
MFLFRAIICAGRIVGVKLPSAEYDGDSAAILHEFDPFQP